MNKAEFYVSPSASAKRVSFEDTSLKKARFFSGKSRINLSGSTFNGADLTEAQLEHTILKGVDFNGAKIVNANFRWTNFTDADLSDVFIEESDFRGAIYSSSTKFPAGFSPADNKMKKIS